jgi:hypothetical protein
LTGEELPGAFGVPFGLQSGPDVQLWLGVVCWGWVCPGEAGAPPLVWVAVAGGAVWVAGEVVVACVAVAGLVEVVVTVAVAVVVERVLVVCR